MSQIDIYTCDNTERDIDSITPTAADSDDDVTDSTAEGHSEVITDEEELERQQQDAEDFEIMRQTLQQIVQGKWSPVHGSKYIPTSVAWCIYPFS